MLEGFDYTAYGRQQDEIEVGDFQFPTRYKKGEKQGLLVVFNGWDPYKKYSGAPSFYRWKELQGLGYSTLYVSQPSLKGFKISHAIFSLLRTIFRTKNEFIPLLKSIRDELGIANSDMIFYGKSSGCNPACIYSLLFPGSKLIMVNPEINPVAHDMTLVSEVAKLLVPLVPENTNEVKNTANLITIIPKYRILPDVYLHQNALDTHYQKNHIEPFINMFNSAISSGSCGSLMVDYCYSEKGHHSEMEKDQIGLAIDFLLGKKRNDWIGVPRLTQKLLYSRQTMLAVRLEHIIHCTRKGHSSVVNLVVMYDNLEKDVFPLDLATIEPALIHLSDQTDCSIDQVYLEGEQVVVSDLDVSTTEYLLGIRSICY